MLRNIHLHGLAGELFGTEFRLDVKSLAEAVRALGAQLPGFRVFLSEYDFQCVRGSSIDDGFALGDDDIHFGLGKADLHIVPVIQGSGGGKGAGVGKIVAGILLAGVAFWAAPALGVIGLTGSQGLLMGVGLVAAGVSQIISAQAKPQDQPKSDSFGFSGVIGTATQGQPIPLIYGHIMVKNPQVISAAIYAEDIEMGGDN